MCMYLVKSYRRLLKGGHSWQSTIAYYLKERINYQKWKGKKCVILCDIVTIEHVNRFSRHQKKNKLV